MVGVLSVVLWAGCARVDSEHSVVRNNNSNTQRAASLPPFSDASQFGPFWLDLQNAVRQEDRQRLFELTRDSYFMWSPHRLELAKHGYQGFYYWICTREEFDRNYDEIFSPVIRSRILSQSPERQFAGDYVLEWRDRKATYMLYFDLDPYGDYKYSGLQLGPP